ncbi:oligosaccharide flippase family protein [Elizabethkingia meningoseptica]|uniref:oligosaccharide flippase family protein n=1 Tax=Elizabethkingia meningoseptica TaxID=238 RepID=UPI00084217B7|nr:oligosaccharide flippase family protein [Elizabethkingia meningoseptica]ODM54979.1 transporter [Elizabethkingia meningoseptica]OHT30185.1 transporter [Elizabethkingia meningoseptica]OPC11858.1 transporter [Elizabethkingia meningoseptica]
MKLNSKLNNILILVKSHKEIIENYFFMTLLQILNSFFYLLIYPYLIKTLGSDNYGLFVFITSIVMYFVFFVNFGFDLPATKAIALALNDKHEISRILSCIYTGKVLFFAISVIVYFLLIFIVPFLYTNKELAIITFLQIINFVIFPNWYFQAIQKMKIVTLIQLSCKILTLPLIFLFVKSKNDLIIYATIVSGGFVFGGIIANIIIVYFHNIKIKFVKLKEIKVWIKDSLPFFLSNSTGIIKEQSVALIIGAFFGMKEVAIYDLANKIVSIPRTLLMSINGAIFPKLILNIDSTRVKKIIKYEFIISILVILMIIICGSFIVRVMGGIEMKLAYPLAILLSCSIMSWLIVGAYINFVFVPNKVSFYAVKNQIVALISFLLVTLIGLLVTKNLMILGVAICFSALAEIFYCIYITKKYKFL